MRIRFGRNWGAMPASSPVRANQRPDSRRRATLNATTAAMNTHVQIASDDCVDAYTVLNENAPRSSAASAAVARSVQRLAAAKSSIGVVALSATCTSSGIHGRSPNTR